MIDENEPCFLYSFHGTILYYDEECGRLRHGNVATAPRNLFVDPGAGGVTLRVDDRSVAFAVRPLRGARFALEAGEHFLCADLGGEISHDRPVASDWESFVRLTGRTVDVLAALSSHRWMVEGESHAVGARLRPRFKVRIGSHKISLARDPEPFVLLQTEGERINRLAFRTGAHETHVASRFDPVVYYCVFGSDSYFECLGLSIRSLVGHGRFAGRIVIVSDREPADLAAILPAEAQSQIEHVLSRPSTRLDMLFARYAAVEALSPQARPILYLDADVVIDRPIDPVLAELRGEGAYIATEARVHPDFVGRRLTDLDRICGWFGRELMLAHEDRHDQPLLLGSSGLIGFRDRRTIEPIFTLVRQLGTRLAAVDAKRLLKYSDQQVFDYVLERTGLAETALLDAHVRYSAHGRTDPERRRGFMHFHAGIGNSDWKAAAMHAYLDALGPPADPASAHPAPD